MPFIGKDWRSPGDQWVRTTEGWERTRLWREKVFGHLNQNVLARLNRRSDVNQNFTPHWQPHILCIMNGSRERAQVTSLSETIVRLDMLGAVRDIRRANYVSKLMFLILTSKLPTLSGTSQKLTFNIVESMFDEAFKTELNIGNVRELLTCSKEALQQGKYTHIGSPSLWSKHAKTVEKLEEDFARYQLKQRKTDGKPMLPDLPVECLRIILTQLPDHEDIVRTGQTSSTLNEMAHDSILWKQLCLFHFTNGQILPFFPSQENGLDIDWKQIYKRCYKRHGKKETYADMLAMCSLCCCIHWKSLGHPCTSEKIYESKPLSPEKFLALFGF